MSEKDSDLATVVLCLSSAPIPGTDGNLGMDKFSQHRNSTFIGGVFFSHPPSLTISNACA